LNFLRKFLACKTATIHTQTVTCNMPKTIQITLLLILIPFIGFCCDCVKSDVQKNFEKSEIVITAEVIKIDKVRLTEDKNYKVKVQLKIEKNFKGTKSERIEVITGNGFGDCGFRFEKGER